MKQREIDHPWQCGCGRPLNRKSAVRTRVGLRCRKCAERLPVGLRRPRKGAA